MTRQKCDHKCKKCECEYEYKCKKRTDSKCKCDYYCSIKCNYCRIREFQNCPGKFYEILSMIKKEKYGNPICPTLVNAEEIKYKNYNYNGSSHKGLQHNTRDGRLVSNTDYENMRDSIIDNDQKTLAAVPLATGSTLRLGNPLAALATLLIGAQQAVLKLVDPPSLSSKQAAAEMVEIYAQAIARDVPFIEYNSNITINHLLQPSDLNNPEVLLFLENSPAVPLLPFTPQTIFRGIGYNELIGPYISQFLLLDVIAGALRTKQLWLVPPTNIEANAGDFRVEWGVNLQETINLQNGNLALLPPPTPANKLSPRYIYSGRSLAETVHNDPTYQFFYNAALILQSLGTQPNPGWPVYPNQGSFSTNNGSASLLSVIGDVTNVALKHSWYWKFLHYRKLRPETFGLWVQDIKTGLVSNKNNFDISDILLNNHVLVDILNINNATLPGSNSYTLPQAYREGAPLHPAYVSGHAIIAGACITILKIYFNGEQKWSTLQGVISGSLSGIPNSIVQANNDGTSLVAYVGDITNITVSSELNKLASNDGIGRNWAGIHYRSDIIKGIILGETVAIAYMQDLLSTMVENKLEGTPPYITFRKYDGSFETIKPTVCEQVCMEN